MPFDVKISHQIPVELTDDANQILKLMLVKPNIDPVTYNQTIETAYRNWLVDPLFNQPNTSITDITDPKHPAPLDADDIEFAIQEVIANPDVHQEDIRQLNTLFNRSMKYSQNNTTLNFLNVIPYQTLNKQQLPLPSSRIKYTFKTDILPNAKDLMSQSTWNYDTYLKTLGTYSGYFLHDALIDQTNIILVRNDDLYNQLVDEIINYATSITNADPNLNTLMTELQKNNHFDDLFNTWLVPQDLNENTFQRVILYKLFDKIINNQNDFMFLPLNLRTMRQNQTFMFINLENLSHATPNEFRNQLNQLKHGFARLQKFNIASIKHLMSAQKIAKNNQRSNSYRKKPSSQLNQIQNQSILTRQKLSKPQLIKLIIQITKHQIAKQQSDNQFKTQYKSFMRPNRRHPNDPNFAGQIQRIQYHPDIHVYLDTSGSISEDEYKQSIKMLIQLAKSLNSNFYFTSFADRITQPIKLHLKNRSIKQIYQEFKRCPKITGGTEYENVWTMIDQIDTLNQHQGRASQLNFIITDFMYDVRSSFIPNLKGASTTNTYYLSVDEPAYETQIRQAANDLADELIDKGDFSIKSRILI